MGRTEQRGGFMHAPTTARHLVRACASAERRRDRAKLAAGRQSSRDTSTDSLRFPVYVRERSEVTRAKTCRETGFTKRTVVIQIVIEIGVIHVSEGVVETRL